MTAQSGPPIHEDHLRQGGPTLGAFAETCSRLLAGGDLAIAATGVVLSVAVPLQVGDLISNITFVTGGTAAGTPTAGFAALYSNAATPALLAQTADFAATARAANTAYTVALATPQRITTAGIYYVAISFTATTVPTLRGVSLGNAAVAGALGLSSPSAPKVLAQTHGSAVGGTAPATIATPTTAAVVPYLVLT